MVNMIVTTIVEPEKTAPGKEPIYYPHRWTGQTKVPLQASPNGSVFTAHYISGSVPLLDDPEKLAFEQIGSFEIPDLTPFLNTSGTLEFNGKIFTARQVFEIAHQLKKVTVVGVFIDSSQVEYTEKRSRYFSNSPLCPHVKSFKVTMDLNYFYSKFQHQCNGSKQLCAESEKCLSSAQKSLITLVESLLHHAQESFPNLENLIVDLPENPRLSYAVQSLIKVCRNLREKTRLVNLLFPVDGMPCSPGYGGHNFIYNERASRNSSRDSSHQRLPIRSPTCTNIYANRLNSIYQASPPPTIPQALLLVPIQAKNVITHNNQPPPGFAPLPLYYPSDQYNLKF